MDNNNSNIRLHAKIVNKALYVEIDDNGKGISSTTQSSPLSSKPEGHGIGLVLSRATLARLGGSLELLTLDKNKGTRASIHLPLSVILSLDSNNQQT